LTSEDFAIAEEIAGVDNGPRSGRYPLAAASILSLRRAVLRMSGGNALWTHAFESFSSFVVLDEEAKAWAG